MAGQRPDAVPAGIIGRSRSRLAGVPLQVTLVALLMALVAAALLVAGLAAVAALRGYLVAEVDGALTDVAARVTSGEATPEPDDGFGPKRTGPLGQQLSYITVTDATGTVHRVISDADSATDPPVLPDMSVTEAGQIQGAGYVVDSESGQLRWRAITVPFVDGSGSVTVAQDISGIDDTVARLALIELAIGVVVLVALGAAGWVLVRRSLRPLDGVENSAAAIAAGDLDRRAPQADPRTEVGSLAASFNTMVDNLQRAFAAQQASQVAALEAAAAARASEARMRQFVADASHELRTPLTSVRGFAELFRIGAVPSGAPLDDAMARIEAEAARMGILVDDLLLLARLDRQRPLEQKPVDVVALVADGVAAARAGAPERDLRVEVAPEAIGLTVPGDAARLRQVVDNLLSNALRYSPADQPVTARVGTSPGPGGSAGCGSVEIVDHGRGMAPDVAARVFERFYRADRARSRTHGGSGLGLAIVDAIVAAHGGRVEVDSVPGRGSTFRVLLPLGPNSAAPVADPTAEARAV